MPRARAVVVSVCVSSLAPQPPQLTWQPAPRQRRPAARTGRGRAWCGLGIGGGFWKGQKRVSRCGVFVFTPLSPRRAPSFLQTNAHPPPAAGHPGRLRGRLQGACATGAADRVALRHLAHFPSAPRLKAPPHSKRRWRRQLQAFLHACPGARESGWACGRGVSVFAPHPPTLLSPST